MGHLLTTQEVASLLRVDITTVRRWIYAGLLPAVKLPHVRAYNVYRIKSEIVEEILARTTKCGQKK
jgi:excisionase family DNA binding protein